MTAKKPSPKKRRKTPARRKKALSRELKKALVGLAVLLLLVALAGFLTHYLILRRPGVPPSMRAPEQPVQSQPPPAYEVFPPDKAPTKPLLPPARPVDGKPRVAIIIDDLGYQKRLADRFLDLDAVLTVSLLPHSPFQNHIAESAHVKGIEIMLHLPMEPHEYPEVDAGPGTLLTGMSPDQLIDQLTRNVEAIPHVQGVNNHMGSKLTEDSDKMHQIFITLKKRGLYYIDSRTTSETVSEPAAHLFQVPFGQRDVFIDHLPEPGFIRKQLEHLVRIAQSRGKAIGIAHPHQVTYDVLHEMLPELKKKVELVPASELVESTS